MSAAKSGSTLDALWRELGITPAMTAHLPRIKQAANPEYREQDCFERMQRMTQPTGRAWCAMRAAAREDGVAVLLVSAFRSVAYQADIFRRKLERGQTLQQILRVNAVPGCSEHHSGCALDLSTPDCEALSLAFEHTDAYVWLMDNAAQFGFSLSYPRGNPRGVAYEPWHWALREGMAKASGQ